MSQPLHKGKTGANAVGFVILTIAALGAANLTPCFAQNFEVTPELISPFELRAR